MQHPILLDDGNAVVVIVDPARCGVDPTDVFPDPPANPDREQVDALAAAGYYDEEDA